MNGAVLTPSQATPLARSVLAHAAWIAL
ncbi:MAG: hypothetical protein QG554_1769, partial [Pseudomonadota bacterium]|nr:hypothetical protein [Pseudomonadota bacterium]